MLSADRLEYREPSKRNIWPWHLCAIYGLLALCILMGILSFISLHHLNRRQKDFEMKMGCSGCSCFDAHQSSKDKDMEPASVGGSQDENVDEDEVGERQSLISDADTNASSSRAAEVSVSIKNSRSEMVLHRSSRNADPSKTALGWKNSEDARVGISVEVPSNHQAPEEEVTSFPSGLSNSSESSTTGGLNGRSLLKRLPRQTRGSTDEEDAVTISDRQQERKQNRKQRTTSMKPDERKRNRRNRQQKLENKSHHQGMAAIHLQAPEHMDRQYESGPMISLNASYTKDTVYRFWRKASWVPESVADVFHLDETTGHVTVEIEGLYMIYAQVVYHDLSGRWSFGIYVGDQEKVKCLATEQLRDLHSYHPSSHGVYQNCYTAIVLHIRKNQSVSIRCMYGSRTILTRPEFTFWGMVRLS